MIHVLTVHWKRPDWIEVQRRYLDRFMGEPFRLVACVEEIPEPFHRAFDQVVPSIGGHADNLNHLAQVVLSDAAGDDLLVFLDGDAFPIADPMPVVRERLAAADLTAVRRDENAGDRQPHPSFCAVSVQVWRDLPGDWSAGWEWRPGRTDVGGNLLGLLERSGRTWSPLLRSNRHEAHPVLCGIYADIVYHHGAGFRPGWSTTLGDRSDATIEQMSLEERTRHNDLVLAMVRAHIDDDPDFFRLYRDGLTQDGTSTG